MERARVRIVAGALLLLAGADPIAQRKPLRAPDVRYEPSPHEVVAQMLQVAGVRAGDLVYDLGCGDGRIVIAAARLGAKGVGIDIDPERIAESRENAKLGGVTDRVVFRNEDLFEADISRATVVTLFLWPGVNLKLRAKLLADLKPGTRVVSYYWDMGDWAPDKTVAAGDHSIYLWTVPSRQSSRRSIR